MKVWEQDKSLSLMVLSFVGLGLVQVYSSSFIYASEFYGNGYFFFFKQLFFSIIGVCIFFTTRLIPWSFWERYGFFLWVGTVLLLILTFIPQIGVSAGGASRWIRTPFVFRLEPAEFFKVTLPFLVAAMVVKRDAFLKVWQLPVRALVLGIPFFLLLKQPDFGSFVICSLLVFSVFFVFGLRFQWVFLTLFVFTVSFLGLILSSSYRYTRFKSFMDPWADPLGSGFQIIQSFLSFNAGGFFGVGPGGGQSKLFFLPEAHTDFTLSVLGEEWGFLGILFVVFLTLLFIFIGFQIVFSSKDVFMRAVAFGLVLCFAFPSLINLGVVLGFLPTKGLAFPFLSYGGSSLISSCWAMGLLASIGSHNRRSHSYPSKRVFV